MAKPEGPLGEYLRQMDEGRVTPYDDGTLAEYGRLHQQITRSATLTPSLAGRIRGQQRMLTALADSTKTRGGRQMIPTFLAAVPKAVLTAIGVIALTGGAMTASAAAGGPNIPAVLLAAVGLGNAQEHDSGISTSNVSETGREHANPNALDGAGNADDKGDNRATPASGAGQSNASQTGLDHRSDKAGTAGEAETRSATPESGITRSQASDTGVEKANVNAADGAANASAGSDNRVVPTLPTVVPSVTPGSQAQTPEQAQTGADHATLAGSNADGARQP
jgi:hypothetical protein